MSLILIFGPQAVGKMTVGRALEKRIDGRLLFNHETIDIFSKFLGFTSATFELSRQTRRGLFKAFTENTPTNVTTSLIFTAVMAFDIEEDMAFFDEIVQIFSSAGQAIYFVELVANLDVRLARNQHEDRLAAKPSKRDIAFSESELLAAADIHRLNSLDGEILHRFPNVSYLKINNTHLAAQQVADQIVTTFHLT
ncbi:MAG: AAA family ATPase [Streptococcaceae bacterium]|jgi:hypothetical protein|nr:AAA family ATPase [Streptococcaceae bacterium]